MNICKNEKKFNFKKMGEDIQDKINFIFAIFLVALIVSVVVLGTLFSLLAFWKSDLGLFEVILFQSNLGMVGLFEGDFDFSSISIFGFNIWISNIYIIVGIGLLFAFIKSFIKTNQKESKNSQDNEFIYSTHIIFILVSFGYLMVSLISIFSEKQIDFNLSIMMLSVSIVGVIYYTFRFFKKTKDNICENYLK